MKLSLAMIVKNEAAHLGHCLDSVRGLVDEMVVVDTGSTDDTVAVARERGARVSYFPWTGDFSAARNESLAQASGDWVLVLDADEALDEVDFPLIRQAVAQGQVSGFQLLVRNYLPNGDRLAMDEPAKPNPGGYTEGKAFAYCGDSRTLRLFKRLPGLVFQGRIHELVEPWFQANQLPVLTLDAVIHHYGQVLADRVEGKKCLYLDLAKRDVEERPDVLESHYHLVLQAMAAEAWETACSAIAAMGERFPQELPAVTFVHGLSLQYLNRHPEALAVFDKLLAQVPGHVTAIVRRGVTLGALGRAPEAREAFLKALETSREYPAPWIHLADLDADRGDPKGARETLMRGLERFPRDASLWNRLVRLGVEAGRTPEAVKDAWSAIQHCPGGGQGLWHRLVVVALLQQGAQAPARAVLQQGLAVFPGNPELAKLLEGF